MAQAYQLIQAVTVGASGAASIDFTNIPQTYTDLVLKYSARSSTGTNWYGGIPFSLNGTSTSTSSSQRGLYGTGSAAASENYTNTDFVFVNGNGSTASTFANGEIYIPNYAGSNYKSISADMVTENNATTALAYLDAALWSNTSAINRITITPASGTITQYSAFYLYGIGGTRASGGTITADSQYTYHTFTSSGTFTALEKIKGAEVLLVAGGGGGGGRSSYYGAGGGGGGVSAYSLSSLTAGTSYSAIIGAGATGTTATSGAGSDSQFTVNRVTGGGGGTGNGGAAGSGGSPNGGAGGLANGSNSGAKGSDGPSTYSAWGLTTGTGQNIGGMYYYGGGGGGAQSGTGGAGGGGNGASSGNGNSGTANTGGGGGGAFDAIGSTGGNGGSGLVIIRYPN